MSHNGNIADPSSLKQKLAELFSWRNRGLLLDITILLVNVLLMWVLTPLFLTLIQYAVAEDPLALTIFFIITIAAFILPPAAAILKRHSYHRNRKAQSDEALGCLFNPIFYFCLQIFILSSISSFISYYILGMPEPVAEFFFPSLLIILILAVANTVFVFLYFSPPKNPERPTFLKSHNAASLGDVFIFVNMIIYQLVWNLLTAGEIFSPVSGISEFVGRLFFLTFIAFLIYFPPRIFYLADDVNKPRTWLMMFLANSPVIFRVLFGGGS